MHSSPRPVVGFALSTFARLASLACFACLASACSKPAQEGQFPAKPEGCAVQLFHGSPSISTDNIGPVSATCAENVTDEDCMRTLKDEACKLGGDVVWGVPDAPTNVMGKKRFTGRAARSKAPAAQ